MKFGWEIAMIALLTGVGVFIILVVGIVWAITSMELPGKNPADFERRKRVIEAYARSLVWCVLGAVGMGALLVIVLVNGSKCIW